MKKTLLFLLFIIMVPLVGFSQFQLNQSLNRSEYTFGIGPSAALTDIGGSPSTGTHFLKDFNFGAIRYAGFLGYRLRIGRAFSIKGIVTLADLYGNDNLSSNPVRFNRNQDFRTFLAEPSLQFEYHFFEYNQPGHRYKIKHAHGFRTGAWDAYLFGGVAGFYFNPQGKYNGGAPLPTGMNAGQWYNLRPLSTEGEGLPGGPPMYSQLGISFPVGLGIKYRLNNNWSLGIEFSDRLWTSTDYLDDSHGTYFSAAEIQQYKGPVAAYFSHPVLGLIGAQDATGQERADPTHNDTYMFMFICLNYHINSHHRWGRAKF